MLIWSCRDEDQIKNLGAFLPPNQKLGMNFNKGLILKPFSLDRVGKLTTFLEWWQEGASRRLSHIYQSVPGGQTSVTVPHLTLEGCRVNDQIVAWKGMNTAEKSDIKDVLEELREEFFFLLVQVFVYCNKNKSKNMLFLLLSLKFTS